MTVSSFRGSSSNFDGCETACLFTTERASERAHFALTPRSAFKCVEDRPVAFQFLLTIQLCESNRILQSWCALQSANNYSQPCIFTSCELSDSGLANRYRLVPCVHHSAYDHNNIHNFISCLLFFKRHTPYIGVCFSVFVRHVKLLKAVVRYSSFFMNTSPRILSIYFQEMHDDEISRRRHQHICW